LQRPWSANDFRQAEIDLAADKKISKFKEEQDTSLGELHQDNARVELAPVVDRKFTEATTTLAKLVGDDIHQTLTSGGWDALHAKDPVTAEVMAATLNLMHPFIEATIQIDDPRGRVRIDLRNPAHAQWNQAVTVGEASLVGTALEDGRMFAKRADYARMTPAQQSAHWFLSTDMIVQGALDYAAGQVKTVADQRKNRLKSLGYVRQEPGQAAAAPGDGGTQATSSPAPPAPAAIPPNADKPQSPSVGSGAKIDDKGGAPKTSEAALMQQLHGILFRR
jgi:hypothetical protein